jgi:hypothetical protein
MVVVVLLLLLLANFLPSISVRPILENVANDLA